MQAGKLRFFAAVEQLIADSDAVGWQELFSGYFDFRTLSEGDGIKRYSGLTRWRPEWEAISGTSTTDEGFRIAWKYGEKDGDPLTRYLAIDRAFDPDNRRREIELELHEIEGDGD